MDTNQIVIKKPFYKRKWVWVVGVIIFFILISGNSSKQQVAKSTADTNQVTPEQKKDDSVTNKAAENITQKDGVSTSNTNNQAAETPNVSAEYKSALNSADSYANTMHMSKRKLYDQLVSEYGEKFTKDAAQYAVDNVKADWNANALAAAKNYQTTMNMSPAKIHDQLTSEYGEKFTKAEADYAIQHLGD